MALYFTYMAMFPLIHENNKKFKIVSATEKLHMRLYSQKNWKSEKDATYIIHNPY